MNAILSVRQHRTPGWKSWTLLFMLGSITRAQAIRRAVREARIYRRVRLELLPSKEIVEWRDGVRQ